MATDNTRSVPRRLPRSLVVAIAAGLAGLAGGFGLGRWSDDPHTATAEQVTGTVVWSNEQDRIFMFETDGEVRKPSDGHTIYYVVRGDWTGIDGKLNPGYPSCLASKGDHPVSEDRHRLTLTVIHRDTGGRQAQNIATHIHCLD